MKYFLLGALSVVMLGFATAGAYFVGLQKGRAEFAPTPTPTVVITREIIPPTTAPSPTPTPITREVVKAAVVAAVTSRSYESLRPFMVQSPEVILESSGCCGRLTQDNAISQLSYLNNAASPWNFDDANSTAAALRAKNYAGRYIGAIIGIAQNEYTVAVQLDGQNKISRITMATTYKLVLP